MRGFVEEQVGLRDRQGVAVGGPAGGGAKADRGQIAIAIVVGVEDMQIAGIDAEGLQLGVADHAVAIGIVPDQRRDAAPAAQGGGILLQQGEQRIGLARAGAVAGVAGQQDR